MFDRLDRNSIAAEPAKQWFQRFNSLELPRFGRTCRLSGSVQPESSRTENWKTLEAELVVTAPKNALVR
jgi:hypothetical protein